MTAMAEKKDSLRTKVIRGATLVGFGTAFALGARGDARAPQIDHPDNDPIGTTHVLKKPLNLRGWRDNLPGVPNGDEDSQTQRQRARTIEVAKSGVVPATAPAVTTRRYEVATEARQVGFNWLVVPFVAGGLYSLTELGRGLISGNKKAGLRGTLGMTITSALACGAMTPTPASPEAPLPTPIVQATNAPETATPPVGFQTETPAPPVDIASSHPDFSHPEGFSNVPFSSGATAEQLKANGIIGMPEYAAKAYAENIDLILSKVPGATSARAFWSSDYNKNFVLVGGPSGVAVIAAGADNYSYHPNAEWFDFQPAVAPTYTWVALPGGASFDQVVGGYVGNYPVWGVANPGETFPSSVFAPGSAAEFVAVPKPSEPFSLASAGLSAEQQAAMQAHPGLEGSIAAVEGGKFTAFVSVLNQEGQPVVQAVEVLPATMAEDTTPKDKYDNTPVMLTADGKKVFWIQEQRGWYQVEISPDIHKPVFVPFDKMEIIPRIVKAEFQPFSQAAVDRWNSTVEQWSMGFESRQVNAVTDEWKKWAFFSNRSISEDDITSENSPIQVLDAWWTTTIPDGTSFEFFSVGLLDPANPREAQVDEWKAINCAIGTEISTNESNRNQFSKDLHDPSRVVLPIVRVEEGFLENPSLPSALPITQPSFYKLLGIPGNTVNSLMAPTLAQYNLTYDWIMNDPSQGLWIRSNSTSPGWAYFLDTNNKDFNSEFFADDIQTLLFPSFVMLR